MIKVYPYPEPPSFDIDVRRKGNNWISSHPGNKKYPSYWRQFLEDISSYQGHICSYYGIYIEPLSGAGTIDHFKPKSLYTSLVYEWENYRFCCLDANRKKSNYLDVIDPISLPLEQDKITFIIDFSDGSIHPNPLLSKSNIDLVEKTISRLKLNAKKCKNNRKDYIYKYWTGKISAEFLKERAPLIYSEGKRQNLIP